MVLLFSFLKINLQVNGNSNYEAERSATSSNSHNSSVSNSLNASNDSISSSKSNSSSSSNNSGNSTRANDTQNANEHNNSVASNNNVQNSTNDGQEAKNQNNQTNQNNSNDNNAAPPERQIATFSTKIYTKDSSRQNNMNITASRLNGHIVKNGETFSFCNTLGPSSSANGYQEADIYDNDGNKKKGLGGGNCQISTTLYNAVLAVPSLSVIERHAHSNYVPYIKKGKDAAVAYGSYDFKFKNNSGKDIKLLFEVNNNSVTASIIQIG